jgi:hypothetical protein
VTRHIVQKRTTAATNLPAAVVFFRRFQPKAAIPKCAEFGYNRQAN